MVKKRELFNRIDAMSNEEFIEFIYSQPNPREMNHIIPNGRFPAYTLVATARKNKWTLTKPQRRAISNIYSFWIFHLKMYSDKGLHTNSSRHESEEVLPTKI
ncbi:hypothetical protein [Tetragenococcus halophilus]|uniref:hypothetical protein n=1 Tax=Tetragenococcus halophilus TaxID=51669 RepID=UPI0030E816D3